MHIDIKNSFLKCCQPDDSYPQNCNDPALARFISADTIIPIFSDPQSFNRYSYANNSPLVYTDPNGNNPFAIVIVIGMIIGAASTGIQSGWDFDAMFQGAVIGGAIGGVTGEAGIGASVKVLIHMLRLLLV